MSSDSSPSGLRRSSNRVKRSLASSTRPAAASAFTYQNAQMVKAFSGWPKSSACL